MNPFKKIILVVVIFVTFNMLATVLFTETLTPLFTTLTILGIFVIPFLIFILFIKKYSGISGVLASLLGTPLALLKKNPRLLEKILTGDLRRKEKILEELAKIVGIKKTNLVDDNTIDFLTIAPDKSEHWYRAKFTEEEKQKKTIGIKQIQLICPR